MDTSLIFGIGAVVAIGLVSLLVIGFIFNRLYRRATKEEAFVRTGLGGQLVVMDGGAIVIPSFHELTWVNMTTIRLSVRRADKEALITQDRLLIDVNADFFIRVKADADAIATAARTLGSSSNHEEQVIRNLVEAKLVGALRAAASLMTLDELHENRNVFVQKVREIIADDIERNGLELESAALTSLDQTKVTEFNPDNVLHAVGLAQITKVTEEKKRERNKVEQEARAAIEQDTLLTDQRVLEIGKQRDFTRMETEREVAEAEAVQQAQIAQKQAENDRLSKEARVAAEQAVRTREIESQQAIERREQERMASVAVAEADRLIKISQKSQEESEARARADEARARAVEAAQLVVTTEETAKANREKAVSIIEAEKTAEVEATGLRVAAKASLDAAIDQARALEVTAEGKAKAAALEAQAIEAIGQAKANALRVNNEALNTLSFEQITLRRQEKALEILPGVVREMVEPTRHINSISVVDVSGMGNVYAQGGEGGSAGSNGGSDNLADQVMNAATRYRAAAPIVDRLMSEAGFAGKATVEGITEAVNQLVGGDAKKAD